MSINETIFQNIKNYKSNSLFVKIFILEILFVLIPFLALSMFYYNNTKGITRNSIEKENSLVIYEISDITDTILRECDRLCTYVSNTDRVQMFMMNDWFSNSQSMGDIDGFLRSLPLIYEYIDSMYIYSEFNDQIYNGGRWSSTSEFKDIAWMESYAYVDNPSGVTVARIKNNNYPYFITLIKPVMIENEKKGAVVLNINSSSLYKTVYSTKRTDSSNIYLIDKNREILMSANDNDFARNISEIYNGYSENNGGFKVIKDTRGESFLVSELESAGFGMTYISAMPMMNYTKKLTDMAIQIGIILICLLMLSLVLAFFISVFMYKPVEEIIAVIDNPEKVNIEGKKKNELNYIVTNIITHIRENTEMKQELERRLRLLNDSQIGMLQAQINPHFLYNTLETINWMAVELTDSENSVSAAVTNLAMFLRNAVNDSNYLVSIQNEIEYTKHYLDILELRYGDMFETKWELEEGIEEYLTAKICLQPVIENAVYHGIKPKGYDGLIEIRGKMFDEYILFEIEDNGIGMDEETLEKINRRLHARDYTHQGHIGLYNVSHRIRIIFGDEYGLYVTSEKGRGTCVGITIPKLK